MSKQARPKDSRLQECLKEWGLEQLQDLLAEESLYSLLRELDARERVGFIKWLAELGVCPQPVRQKLVNSLTKAKRAGTLGKVTPPAWDYLPPPPLASTCRRGQPSEPAPRMAPTPNPSVTSNAIASSQRSQPRPVGARPAGVRPTPDFVARRRTEEASSSSPVSPRLLEGTPPTSPGSRRERPLVGSAARLVAEFSGTAFSGGSSQGPIMPPPMPPMSPARPPGGYQSIVKGATYPPLQEPISSAPPSSSMLQRFTRWRQGELDDLHNASQEPPSILSSRGLSSMVGKVMGKVMGTPAGEGAAYEQLANTNAGYHSLPT